MNLIINMTLLDKFCADNDFIVVTDEMLKDNNMYKDIVYASNNNFVGKAVYPKEMPIIMNNGVWIKLININKSLMNYGLCLKIYDAYRPVEIQRLFWDYFYETHGYNDETLVANPEKYGTHNITINAVDMFVVNLDGSDVELPCQFDDFSEKAGVNYNGCSNVAKENRDLLINISKENGLVVNEDEWWHFYDDRLLKYGMKYNYSKSDFIPIGEENVFILCDDEGEKYL